MYHFFSVNNEFFGILGYSMSYVEFLGVLSGLISVWLSAKANIWSWPIGIINVILSFLLYFQVQLYPDMFLQIFFFITNIIGWWRWTNPRPEEEDKKSELKISYLTKQQLLFGICISLFCIYFLGKFASNLHKFFPSVFSIPSAFPFIDSYITIMSILATFYMIQKKIECWYVWIALDIVATCLYYVKGVRFYSMEYLLFTGMAIYGLFNWMKEYKSYSIKKI